VVEDKLKQHIADGNIKAIMFYLSKRNKKYKPKTEIDLNDNRDTKVVVEHVEVTSREQAQAILKAKRK